MRAAKSANTSATPHRPSLRLAVAAPDVRERALLAGVDTLHDAELLALVLGTGAAGEPAAAVAVSLLAWTGGLAGVVRLGAHGLADRRGIGHAKAARLMAAFELGRRVTLSQLGEQRPLCGSFDQVAQWAQPRLGCLEHEEVWVLCLDGRNGVKSIKRVAQGGLHGCALTARDILRPPLLDGASSLVLVHNHPSGDPTPSEQDIHMTRSVAVAAEVVGLALLDHVVVARSGSQSLLKLGLLTPT
jgi:DNA repair protein RadC